MSYICIQKDESIQAFGAISFSAGKVIDDLADKYRDIPQDGGDGAASKGLIFPEQYLDGHINILGILGVPQGKGGVVAPYCQAVVFENVIGLHLDDHLGGIGVQIADIEAIKTDDGSNRYDEFVLVGNVEYMQAVKKIVPARVRLKIAEFLSDFFAGSLYLSVSQNRLKTLGFPAKGKLDLVRDRLERPQNIPSQMVERRSEIVNCVPYNHGEVVGNGCVYIDDQGALVALSILNDGKPAAVVIKQCLRLGNKILDVMYGPL